MVVALMVVTAICSAWLVFVRGVPIRTFRDRNVSAGELWRPWHMFAVHYSPPKYISASGKTYWGVRGTAPFYLEVPGDNSILFITENLDLHVTVNVVSLTGKPPVAINIGHSGFGWKLGRKSSSSSHFSEWVERPDQDHLTLLKSTDSGTAMILINLVTREVEKTEMLERSKSLKSSES